MKIKKNVCIQQCFDLHLLPDGSMMETLVYISPPQPSSETQEADASPAQKPEDKGESDVKEEEKKEKMDPPPPTSPLPSTTTEEKKAPEESKEETNQPNEQSAPVKDEKAGNSNDRTVELNRNHT